MTNNLNVLGAIESGMDRLAKKLQLESAISPANVSPPHMHSTSGALGSSP
ncbi:hypothetical protein [Xanthomonas vasicola]|nr:hypothetical protein [Xanthomonas vasicola]MDO6985529.1 hypothetical protein [Xanthomonas vasicola]